MSGSSNNVLCAPLLDPGMGRKEIEAPHGLTIAEIVALALPGFREPRKGLRVLLVTDKGAAVVAPAYWSSVRPSPHARVVIRTVPGKDALRSVLLAVVSIAAAALAPLLFPALGKVGLALATSGLTVVGQLLVNALIPPTQPESEERRNVYNIDGWRNQARPGAPVPYLFGKHRYAPPFAASSWTEVVGDQQYVRALFCLGYGPLRISDLRIGDTPISDYEDVDVEIREGREDDLPIGLYPEQVLEENAGVQLVRPKPRDLTGEIIPGSVGVETPVTRFTASNSTEASVILAYPTGLFAIDDKGRVAPRSVSVRIRARLNGEGVWQDVVTLAITAKKQEGFLRQHRWVLPTRGRWQIEVTRMTDDSTSTQASDKVVLSGIQSIRPEYPINFDKPLALVAIRVRATYQLNGPLNAFNALIEREALIHEEGAWVTGYGRTPASAYVAALTGPMNPFPAASSAIDWDQIADWHDWCVEKGLKYDRVHDGQETLGEMLLAICAAGRASPRHDGVKWGVVIDRPQALVVDHINPRNSDQFEWSRSYFNPPDGVRVRFLDETNNYEEAEMVIPWPGHVGEIRLTETMEMPGKTDPAEIYIEARRRMDDVPLALLANAHEAELCAPALTRVRGVDESGIGRSFVMRRDRTPGAVVASTRGRLKVTTVYGQSYGTGGGAADQYDEDDPIFSTVVSPDPSFRNLDLMLNPTEDGTGISMTQGDPLNAADLVDFNPAAESPWDPTTTLGGELGMRAFAAFLRASQRADGIVERPHLLFSHGDGGQSLPVLADTDGNPYKNGLIAMAAVKRIAAVYGYDIALETFIWDHGQAASSYPYGQYTTEFLDLWADYKADMLAITGQSLVDNPLMTIVHQIASNAVTRGGRPNAIDQLDLMNNNPGAILTIPGPYHLTVADDTHLDKASTVLQREQVAKIMEVHRRTGSWTGVQPLALENWTVDGNQLTIPYATQGYDLAFEPDIGVIPPPEDGNKGFWSPGLTITAAEIIGSSVRLTYSASLGGEVPRVLYAYRRDTNPPGEPYYGARGMLRNTDATPSREFPQITLPTWAYVFDNKPEEGQPAGVQ